MCFRRHCPVLIIGENIEVWVEHCPSGVLTLCTILVTVLIVFTLRVGTGSRSLQTGPEPEGPSCKKYPNKCHRRVLVKRQSGSSRPESFTSPGPYIAVPFRKMSCRKQRAHTILAPSSGWTEATLCHLHDRNRDVLRLVAFYDALTDTRQCHDKVGASTVTGEPTSAEPTRRPSARPLSSGLRLHPNQPSLADNLHEKPDKVASACNEESDRTGSADDLGQGGHPELHMGQPKRAGRATTGRARPSGRFTGAAAPRPQTGNAATTFNSAAR